MARSYKKTPIVPPGRAKMKPWKRKVNRKMRKITRQKLNSEGEDAILPEDLIEISDLWCSPSDGKTWIGDLEDWMPGFYDKMMRK